MFNDRKCYLNTWSARRYNHLVPLSEIGSKMLFRSFFGFLVWNEIMIWISQRPIILPKNNDTVAVSNVFGGRTRAICNIRRFLSQTISLARLLAAIWTVGRTKGPLRKQYTLPKKNSKLLRRQNPTCNFQARQPNLWIRILRTSFTLLAIDFHCFTTRRSKTWDTQPVFSRKMNYHKKFSKNYEVHLFFQISAKKTFFLNRVKHCLEELNFNFLWMCTFFRINEQPYPCICWKIVTLAVPG